VTGDIQEKLVCTHESVAQELQVPPEKRKKVKLQKY
jgi:hypothetical protein